MGGNLLQMMQLGVGKSPVQAFFKSSPSSAGLSRLKPFRTVEWFLQIQRDLLSPFIFRLGKHTSCQRIFSRIDFQI